MRTISRAEEQSAMIDADLARWGSAKLSVRDATIAAIEAYRDARLHVWGEGDFPWWDGDSPKELARVVTKYLDALT